MSRSELLLQLDDVIRQATALRVTVASGELPMLADARILHRQAECAEYLIELALVDQLRSTPERTPAEDKAAQRYAKTARQKGAA